ncbi:NmrA family NAD(P)-binding protein [Streptomyces sp. NPDC001415]
MRAETEWPGGRKVVALVTVALELWSPGHWPAYAPMAAAWPLSGIDDTHSTSWADYGVTTGIWRLLDVLGDLTATVGVSGLMAERHPETVMAVHATELAATAPDRVRLVRSDPAAFEVLIGQADRVFANTDFFATGSAVGEYRQGLHLLAAAERAGVERAGVERFIWSSLDSAVSLTGHPVPHFDSKAAVAAHIDLMRSEEMLRKETDGWYTDHVSVLTTAPYFENLRDRLTPRPDGRGGLTFRLPLSVAHYPLVALDDIAWFACHMFDNWQSWGARDLAVIGDSLTGDEIAATFARVTGTPSTYIPMPHDELRAAVPDFGHDYAAMFQFFADRDLYARDRDIHLLRRLHPGLMTLKDWLHHTGWTA